MFVMKYNHQRLLWKMIDEGVSQLKVVEYFEGEGYTEDEVVREIADYEQQKTASAAMRQLPNEGPAGGYPKAKISKKAEALPAKILTIFLALLLIVLITVALALVLH